MKVPGIQEIGRAAAWTKETRRWNSVQHEPREAASSSRGQCLSRHPLSRDVGPTTPGVWMQDHQHVWAAPGHPLPSQAHVSLRRWKRKTGRVKEGDYYCTKATWLGCL